MSAWAAGIALLLVLLVGWVVPWASARQFVAWAAGSSLARPNWRGRPVAPVLGLVWVTWAVGLLVAQGALELAQRALPGASDAGAVAGWLAATPLALPFFGVPFLLVVGCALFGLADDAFGRSGPKGFRGHLSALRSGHVSTGMLKLIGIGGIAFFYGVGAAPGIVARSGAGAATGAGLVSAGLLAALVIALAANLFNLLDVRPGRALKAYVVAAPAPAVAFALAAAASYNRSLTGVGGAAVRAFGPTETTVTAAALVLVVLGPALAALRYDLGEAAMLGDAGSNAAGAIVGYLFTAVLPFAGLAVAAAVLLGLNLLSERVSFTSVIERVPVLAWLDGLGRRPSGDEPANVRGPQGPAGGPVRYHAHEGGVDRED